MNNIFTRLAASRTGINTALTFVIALFTALAVSAGSIVRKLGIALTTFYHTRIYGSLPDSVQRRIPRGRTALILVALAAVALVTVPAALFGTGTANATGASLPAKAPAATAPGNAGPDKVAPSEPAPPAPPAPPAEQPAPPAPSIPEGVSPEQAHNATEIAKAAAERGLPEHAVTIALATAFQESNLHNLDYGDRDSLGLFQQRPSTGWGTPDQIMNPNYSAGKFLDGLVQVPGWQDMPVTVAAQTVQKSAFPDAYAKWQPLAANLTDAVVPAAQAGK